MNFYILLTILTLPYLNGQLVEFDMERFLTNFRNPKILDLSQIARIKRGRLVQSSYYCENLNPSFEYIGGVTVNAAESVIQQIPFVNNIDECIAPCKANPQCGSIELSEGDCRLFSIDYEMNPDKFEKFSVNGIHAVVQKVCRAPRCEAVWQTEINAGYRLDGYIVRIKDGCTKDECIEACQTIDEFKCRSVNYNAVTRTCEMNSANRHSLNALTALAMDAETLFIENNCVEEPSMVCTFEPHENVIPATFDAFYLDIRTENECKKKCNDSPIQCRSYTFGTLANVPMCFISHLTSTEFLGAEEAFCKLSNVQTTELRNCYDFTTVCDKNGFQVIFTSLRDFDGVVFPPHSPSCTLPVDSNISFTFVAPYNEKTCNVNDNGSGHYETELQVQHFKQFITEPDFIIKTECEYVAPIIETTTLPVPTQHWPTVVTPGDLVTPPPYNCPEPVKEPPQIIIQEAQCPAQECPECQPIGPPKLGITVLHRNATELTGDPKIDDELALAFFVTDMNTRFGPRITDVAAVDEKDNKTFSLLDKRGCPTYPYFASKIFNYKQGLYMSHFRAFTFNQRTTIKYRASVEWCWGECKPPICKEDEDEQLSTQNDELLNTINNNRIYVK